MRTYLWNLILAGIWCLMTGRLSLANFVTGFLLAYAVLYVSPPRARVRPYFRKVSELTGFVRFLLVEVAVSSLRVAHDVITPAQRTRPAVIGVPLELEGDAAIALLANLVSLTPGTLSLDVSPDRRTLYVHALFVDDVEQTRRQIKEGFERRVRELLA